MLLMLAQYHVLIVHSNAELSGLSVTDHLSDVGRYPGEISSLVPAIQQE